MQENHFYAAVESPIGTLILTANEKALTGLYTDKSKYAAWAKSGVFATANMPCMRVFKAALEQLDEYFSGKRHSFTLPLAPQGTDFQQKVWQNLQNIPYGEIRSYKDIARDIGQPQAARAVGNANGKNPLCLIIPCHRVVNNNGGLGGYSSGLDKKEWLLAHENSTYQARQNAA
jgi:methylated-DNA-[protein]-cysteine S-methyltransferase